MRLWGPASDLSLTSGGYYAELEDGKFMRTTAIVVPKWRSQNGQILQPEPPQLLNPEAPLGDSPGLENPKAVRGLDEPGAGLGLTDHDEQDSGEAPLIHLQELQQEDPSLEVVQEVDIFMDEPSQGQQKVETTRYQPRRRLHQKTSPVSTGATTTPTLRRIVRGAGGGVWTSAGVCRRNGSVEQLDAVPTQQSGSTDAGAGLGCGRRTSRWR